MSKQEAVSLCPAAQKLEREGWRLVSHWAKFGTCLKYRRGNAWRFVFPSSPYEAFAMRDAMLYVKQSWQPRTAEEEEWVQKTLASIM